MLQTKDKKRKEKGGEKVFVLGGEHVVCNFTTLLRRYCQCYPSLVAALPQGLHPLAV